MPLFRQMIEGLIEKRTNMKRKEKTIEKSKRRKSDGLAECRNFRSNVINYYLYTFVLCRMSMRLSTVAWHAHTLLVGFNMNSVQVLLVFLCCFVFFFIIGCFCCILCGLLDYQGFWVIRAIIRSREEWRYCKVLFLLICTQVWATAQNKNWLCNSTWWNQLTSVVYLMYRIGCKANISKWNR